MTLLDYVIGINDDITKVCIGCAGGCGFFLIATSGWLKENLPSIHEDFKKIGKSILEETQQLHEELLNRKTILETSTTRRAQVDRSYQDIVTAKRMLSLLNKINLAEMEVLSTSKKMTGGINIIVDGDLYGRYWCEEEWIHDHPDGPDKRKLYIQIYKKTNVGGIKRGSTWAQQKRRNPKRS